MSITLEPCRWLYLDKRLMPAEQAQLPVDNHALNFGTSAFESLRVYKTPAGPQILGFKPHLERLRGSLLSLGLAAIDLEEIARAVKDVVAQNKLEEGYLRLLVYPVGNCLRLDPSAYHSDLLILAWHLTGPRFWPGLTLGVSHIHRPRASCTLPRAKVSGLYVVDAVAHRMANTQGYDDAIMLHEDGTVCEVTGANIFMVKDATLWTPPLAHSIAGVTRRFVIELAQRLEIPVKEIAFPLEDLMTADEVFITGTFHGIRPVSAILDQPLPGDVPGQLTRQLQRHFETLLNTPADPVAARWLWTLCSDKEETRPAVQPAYEVRPAQKADIPQLVTGVKSLLTELRGKPGPQEPAGLATTCERLIKGDFSGAIFVAHPKNNQHALLGFISLTTQEAMRTGGAYGLIQELWVHPQHRNDNIGQTLLETATNYCRERNMKKLEVGLPSAQFAQAHRTYCFYQNDGFVDIGPRMRREIQ